MAALEGTQLLKEVEPVVADNLDRHLGMADEVADPKPGQPVGLGEGAHHHDVCVGCLEG